MLDGNLGSGKTVFVQGLAKGLGINPRMVRSPSFALIQEYHGNPPLCHADLYRLSFAEIANLGLEEYWKSENWIAAIEWAEKAGKLVPSSALKIRFKMISKNIREITFTGNKKWKNILKQLSKQKKF